MDGVVDLGFIGENELEEVRLERKATGQPAEFKTLRRLDFGGCRLSIAVDKELDYNGPQDLAGKRIATSYPHLLKAYMDGQGIDFSTCMLTGSVEVAHVLALLMVSLTLFQQVQPLKQMVLKKLRLSSALKRPLFSVTAS